MLEDMATRLSSDSVVLDIGANIGNHTFYLSNVVQCKVIAFEANDDLAHAMDITASEAGLEDRVTVYGYALGEKPSFAEFKKNIPDNLGQQSLSIGRGKIKVRTLDSVGITDAIDAIKIDIEGMELQVLKGGRKLIERHKPALYIECQTKAEFIETTAYLKQLGYLYQDSFNATPTHLFLHESNIENGTQLAEVVIKHLYHIYDLLEISKKLKAENAIGNMASVNCENVRLGEQLESIKSSGLATDGIEQLKSDLNDTRERLKESTLACEKLNTDLVNERAEREFQLKQFVRDKSNDRFDIAVQEKLVAEAERLANENKSLKILLEGQQSIKVALEDSRKKSTELSFILENVQIEMKHLEEDKQSLLKKLETQRSEGADSELLKTQLSEQIEKNAKLEIECRDLASRLDRECEQQRALKTKFEELSVECTALQSSYEALTQSYEEQQQVLTIVQGEKENNSKQLESNKINLDRERELQNALKIKFEKLSVECDALRSSYDALTQSYEEQQQVLTLVRREKEDHSKLESNKVNELTDKVKSLEQDCLSYEKLLQKQSQEHAEYVHGLKSLYEDQQLDMEQRMQLFVQKKIESLEPIQANQDKVEKLIKYRNEIEQMYSERTPLLEDVEFGSDVLSELQQKKSDIEQLTASLREVNALRPARE